MSTMTLPRPAEHGAACVRRTFDLLEVTRLAVDPRGAAVPTPDDAVGWPFLVLYVLAGSATATHDGATALLDAGDCSVLRSRASVQLVAEAPAEVLVVHVPQAAVGPYARVLDTSAGHVYPTRVGTASLVAHLLTGIAGQLIDYAPRNPARLAHHVVGMLALMCSDTAVVDVGPRRRDLLEQAKEYIELHLSDLDLSPERIAGAQHISSRTLHRLFEAEDETIGGWIRNRRLEQCRVDLTDATHDDRSISHIASRWGMWDAAHFSRVFKARYGVSPRAYRTARSRAGNESFGRTA